MYTLNIPQGIWKINVKDTYDVSWVNLAMK